MTTPAAGLPPDENLPEVVPDSVPLPQALSGRDAYLAHDRLGEKDPKYVADTSPRPDERDLKFPAEAGMDGGAPALVKGEDGVWRPATGATDGVSPISPDAATPGAVEEGRGGEQAAEAGKGDERVCGMKRKMFWIVLVVAVIIVCAAIGGGVGGGLAARNSGAADDAESNREPTPTGRPEIDFLNNQTVPSRGIAFQAFSELDYMGSATDIYNTEGFFNLSMNASSYVWIPNDTDCCVVFCQSKANTTQWWCRERFQPEASREFSRLGVLCGTDFVREKKTYYCVPEEEAEELEQGEDEDTDKDGEDGEDGEGGEGGGDGGDGDTERPSNRSVVLF